MFAMKKLILAAFAIAVVVVTSGNADAAFAIRILDSSNTEIARITDNGNPITTATYSDLDPSTTIILAARSSSPTFTINGFNISILTGSIISSGVSSSAGLDVNVTRTGAGAGTISFEVSSDGFTFPGGGVRNVKDRFTTNTAAAPSATVSYRSWINSTANQSTLFDTTGAYSNGLIGPNPILSGANSTNLGGTSTSTGSFSITTRTTFTFTGSGGSVGYTSGTDVTPPANIVPAPAGLLLSLLGLPALAFARRFRRAVPVQA